MTDLKSRLQQDLSAAMKGRDELTTATLRMVLTAVTTEERSGAQAHELDDDEVRRVLAREAKKRREAAEAFRDAGRNDRADRETAERTVIQRYLPAELEDEELAALVAEAIAETGASGVRQMGQVMPVAQAKIAGRAEGRRVAEEVRRQLG